MKKTIQIIAAFLLLAASSFAQNQQIPLDPAVRTGKLSNGITYYIRHNNIPKSSASFYLVQKVGSVLENEDQRGLAHFLEHMAFNGSKHFPGNTIIYELEKKGIKFGANINAYTSFDETVYNLSNIPVSREGVIDTSLLVLHDWSGFLTLNDKDIDDERGVIREEWRLASSNGIQRVLQKDIIPQLFKGTPYANRMPIGSMDIVNNFKYQELRDYYKKWYRPDLQGIIVVGDVNVDQIEKKIKDMFSDIPARVNPAPRIYVPVPDNVEPIVALAADDEIPGIFFNIFWKLDDYPVQQRSSLAYYKTNLINQLIAAMLTTRLGEIGQKVNPPFAGANVYLSDFIITPLKRTFNAVINPIGNDKVLAGLKAMLVETQRMHRYGFTSGELEETKKSMIAEMERAFTARDNRSNGGFVDEYKQHFLINDPAPGIDWEHTTGEKILKDISTDTLNFYARKAMGDQNVAIFAYGKKSEMKSLSKDSILAVWAKAKTVKLSPYIFKSLNKTLLDKKPVAGKIVKTETEPYGYIRWTLSNGAKVWFKRTDYKEDKLQVSGFSPGGMSQVSDADLPSAEAAINIVGSGGFGKWSKDDVNKILNGKDVSVNTAIGQNDERVDGVSSLKDKETLFQLIYLKMTAPHRDSSYYTTWKKTQMQWIIDRQAVPDQVIGDSTGRVMSNYNPRAITINMDSMLLRKVNYNNIIRVYKDRFADASGFNFFIAGNVPADSVKLLAETYLGGLPSLHRDEQMTDHGQNSQMGIVKKHFSLKMTIPKSHTFVAYSGDYIPATLQNEALIVCVADVLKFIYLQKMREEEGGVYYVIVNGWLNPFPKPHFSFQVEYNTDPDPVKKAKLMHIMYAEIDNFIKNGPSQEDLDKAVKNELKRWREWSGEKNANYYNGEEMELFLKGKDRPRDYEKVFSSITPQMLQEFAKKIFSTPNVVELVTDPEK